MSAGVAGGGRVRAGAGAEAAGGTGGEGWIEEEGESAKAGPEGKVVAQGGEC